LVDAVLRSDASEEMLNAASEAAGVIFACVVDLILDSDLSADARRELLDRIYEMRFDARARLLNEAQAISAERRPAWRHADDEPGVFGSEDLHQRDKRVGG
jgi:hypothetical protein